MDRCEMGELDEFVGREIKNQGWVSQRRLKEVQTKNCYSKLQIKKQHELFAGEEE